MCPSHWQALVVCYCPICHHACTMRVCVCVCVCVCVLSVMCLFIGCCECSGTEKKGSCYSLLRKKEETLGKDLGKLSNTIYPSSSSSFSSSFSSFCTAPQEASRGRLQSSCSTNQRSVDTVWTRSIEHVLCCLHMGNMAIEISDNFITLLKVSATVLHTLSAMHLP